MRRMTVLWTVIVLSASFAAAVPVATADDPPGVDDGSRVAPPPCYEIDTTKTPPTVHQVPC